MSLLLFYSSGQLVFGYLNYNNKVSYFDSTGKIGTSILCSYMCIVSQNSFFVLMPLFFLDRWSLENVPIEIFGIFLTFTLIPLTRFFHHLTVLVPI